EALDLRVEARAVLADHLIGALHRSERRIEGAARRVFERVAGLEHGLLTHHARTAHLFHLPGAVPDDPMPREQLTGAIALVAQADRVEEEPLAVPGIGVLGRITRLDLDPQSLRHHLGPRHVLHRVDSTGTPTHSHDRFQSRRAASASRAARFGSRSWLSAK